MQRKTTHLVGNFDTGDSGSLTLRMGDLNCDGGLDLLFVQSDYGSRRITCLTAMTIRGEKLWQTGTPSADNWNLYSDLPVQIYDWDNDGQNEVLYVCQAKYAEPLMHAEGSVVCERAARYEGTATMVVLDGATGVEKYTFALPAPADDCFLFADLTGRGRREDLVVKDRYWNMWGVSHEGEVLWHWKGATGHFPAIGDVDGDGREEVFVGCALIDHDGRVMFQKDWEGWGARQDAQGVTHYGHHQDAATMVQVADGSWRLIFGNGGLHCMSVDGTELWHVPLHEAQHVVTGRYRNDSVVQIAVVDRGYPRTPEGKPADIYLFDLDGREIWRRKQPAGSWCAWINDIDWLGTGLSAILTTGLGEGKPVRIYDGQGEIVDELPGPKGHFYAGRAALWGDRREKAIVHNAQGVSIWANARPLAISRLYNSTLYTGM
jgi:hypothetical protein